MVLVLSLGFRLTGRIPFYFFYLILALLCASISASILTSEMILLSTFCVRFVAFPVIPLFVDGILELNAFKTWLFNCSLAATCVFLVYSRYASNNKSFKEYFWSRKACLRARLDHSPITICVFISKSTSENSQFLITNVILYEIDQSFPTRLLFACRN